MMRIVAILVLVLLLPLIVLVATEPPSWSGAAYVIGFAVVPASFIGPLRKGWWTRRRGALAGAALVLVTLVIRLFAVKPMGDTRLVDRVIDERDVSVNAARAIGWTGFMHDPDVPELAGAMRAAYGEMAETEGSLLPSPFVATYLGLERRGASDTLEFGASGDGAVVFLHGFAGNFTMSCWLMARAAGLAHMTTVCPSTRWVGDWWSAEGEAIARDTIASLRSRGKKRIFLAGLSNGGIGASRLAPKLAGGIAGLVLISGAAPEAPSSGVPTLVIQGRTDAQIPASIASAYAARAGAKYVEINAGHFAMLLERDRVGQAIATWLDQHP